MQHIPVESEREEVRDWVLSVCMDAKIDQALPPEKEAGGTLYQVFRRACLSACILDVDYFNHVSPTYWHVFWTDQPGSLMRTAASGFFSSTASVGQTPENKHEQHGRLFLLQNVFRTPIVVTRTSLHLHLTCSTNFRVPSSVCF